MRRSSTVQYEHNLLRSIETFQQRTVLVMVDTGKGLSNCAARVSRWFDSMCAILRITRSEAVSTDLRYEIGWCHN